MFETRVEHQQVVTPRSQDLRIHLFIFSYKINLTSLKQIDSLRNDSVDKKEAQE